MRVYSLVVLSYSCMAGLKDLMDTRVYDTL